MKKIFNLVFMALVMFVLVACDGAIIVESSLLTHYQRTTYYIGESLEDFTQLLSLCSMDLQYKRIILEDASELTITGFNTETTGTRTLVVTYQVKLSVTYTVINETEPLYLDGDGSEDDPYHLYCTTFK